MSDYYVLDEHGQTVPVAGVHEWMNWLASTPDAKRVARTEIGDVCVSTVFLGMNHQWAAGPPLLFESMIFEGEWDEYQWRWSTRAEAVAGHDQIVAALREGNSPLDAERLP